MVFIIPAQKHKGHAKQTKTLYLVIAKISYVIFHAPYTFGLNLSDINPEANIVWINRFQVTFGDLFPLTIERG